MLDSGIPALVPELGEKLAQQEYKRDFRRRDAEIRNANSWKLERRQHFEEPGDPSWIAMREGSWDEALRLLEEERSDLRASVLQDELNGNFFHRVRVVGEPLTPYIQWELHALHHQAQCGSRIRVVTAESLARAEESGPLPEVVVLGGMTLYHVLYTEAGLPNGAVRYVDPGLVERWEQHIEKLYEAGEEMTSYFRREVAHLPAPKIELG